MSSAPWEVVIGMEVHVQPTTRSKMFCGCAIGELGDPPNSNVCEICLGMPGTLPVINKTAVEACLKTALALNCEIPRHTKFDRKNYMYPDLPKGYQISQYDLPMSKNGFLELDGWRVRIRRVHLEEDTGKLIHAGDKLHQARESFVDLNRAGIPLMEIVTEPDLHSAEEAVVFASRLRELLRAIHVTDADMEQGELRIEPNISIRRFGNRQLGTKTELKNINSFRALRSAIEYEVKRQVSLVESDQPVLQQTRGWSESEQRTFPQRSKEFAEDYRYFPEPDLPPLELDPKTISEFRPLVSQLLGLMRAQAEAVRHLQADLGLPPDSARAIVEAKLLPLMESALAHGAEARAISNLLVEGVLPKLTRAFMNELSPRQIAQLAGLRSARYLNRDNAIKTIHAIWGTDLEPETIARERGWLGQVDDEVIVNAIGVAMEDNPQAVSDYRAGKVKAIGTLVKAVQDACGGKADPRRINQLLRQKLQ